MLGFLIACLIIKKMGFEWWWYAIAAAAWIADRLMVGMQIDRACYWIKDNTGKRD